MKDIQYFNVFNFNIIQINKLSKNVFRKKNEQKEEFYG